MTKDELKVIQKKVYMSYFQDGLWDILIGIFLVSWGLMFHLDMPALGGGLFIGLYFAILALKRWLTYPRLGYAKVAEEQKQKIRMVIAGTVMFLLGLMVFLLIAFENPPNWLGEYIMFFFGCMLAAAISLLAYWWKVNHWYAYAVLIVTGVAFHQWLEAALHLSFIVPGAIIMLIGIAMLVRFLHRYPKVTEEI